MKKENNEKQEWYLNEQLINYLLIVVIVGIVALPIVILSRGIGNKGSIGDAFNGLLAPFISLLAALLVYKSFKAQIRANELQLENNGIATTQWRFDLHIKILDDIKNEFEKFKVTTTQKGEQYGSNALRNLGHEGWNSIYEGENAMGELQGILREFLFLIDRLEKEKDDNRLYFWQKMYLFYTVKLAPHLPFVRNQIVN